MSRAINLSHGFGAAKEKYPTKVVVRRLPPDLTLDAFLPRVSPLPEYDHLYFVRGGNSKGGFSRAYVNFVRYEDVPIFRKKFDGLSFLGNNGVEYPAVVEFAPYQNVPATTPKNADVTAGTVQSDGYYADFLDGKRREEEEVRRRPEFHFRPKIVDEEEEEGRVTPLLKYVNERKRERKKDGGGEKRKFFPAGKQRRYENCVVFVNSAAKKSGNRKLTFV